MKEFYQYTYKLNYDEIYEAFFQLNQRWKKKVRIFVGVVLFGITLIMLAGYYLNSQKMHYFILAIFSILLLYYLIYTPALKAKRGAKKVSRMEGTYQVKLMAEGKVQTEAEVIELAGDKDARVIETRNLYVIRPDSQHTFCLPKRIMKQNEIEEIRELLKEYMKYQKR